MGTTKVASFTTPKYGWITAKPDEKEFESNQAAHGVSRQLQGFYGDTARIRNATRAANALNAGLAHHNYFGVRQAYQAQDMSGVPIADTTIRRLYGLGYDESMDSIKKWLQANSRPGGADAAMRKNPLQFPGMSNPYLPWNTQGYITEKANMLANPMNYKDPTLQRYYDGPNGDMTYYPYMHELEVGGNNSSYEQGGETNLRNVARYYASLAKDPASYGTVTNAADIAGNNFVKNLTFNKDGTNSNYYFTPYDYATSGVNGDTLKADPNWWKKDASLYKYGDKMGFLSQGNPLDFGTQNLGTETNNIYLNDKKPSGGGFLGGGLLSTLATGALNWALPGAGTVVGLINGLGNAGSAIGDVMNPDKGGSAPWNNPFYNWKPEGQPQVNWSKIGNFGSNTAGSNGGATNSTLDGGNTTPNIQNPGTGGSNQTTSSLNKFNWNNVDYSVNNGGLFDPSGKMAWNTNNNTGSTQLGNAYNTYLGSLI